MKCKTIGVIFTALCMASVAFYFFLQPHTTETPGHKSTTPVTTGAKLPHPPASLNPSFSKNPTPIPTRSEPSSESAFEVSDAVSSARASDIVVPPGARVPAALMDGGGPDDSEETRNIMNGIIEEFAQKIEQARLEKRNPNEAWEEAREAADDRYRQFFGFEAFNEATLESAGEAAEESASLNQSPAAN